ncbi:hypothetical protein ACHAPT_006388 [Fusarium lateritium]
MGRSFGLLLFDDDGKQQFFSDIPLVVRLRYTRSESSEQLPLYSLPTFSMRRSTSQAPYEMPPASNTDQTSTGRLGTFFSKFRSRSRATSPALSEPVGSVVPSPTPGAVAPENVTTDQNEPPAKSSEGAGESELWLEALEKTDERTRESIEGLLNQASDKAQADELVSIVKKREEQFKDETPKMEIGGREIIWRNYASRVISRVTDIGDIAIPFAPSPSSTVWSALKVLLKAHVSQCEDLVAILGCAEKVLRLVKRGKIYEVVYLHGTTNDSHMSTEGLRGALIDAYQKALELLAHAADQLTSSGGKRFLQALGSPGGGDGLVQDVFKAEQRLSLAVQACEVEHRQMDNAKNRELLQRLSEPLRYVDHGVRSLLESMEENNLLRALRFISNINVGKQHEIRSKRTDGTCEWLFSDARRDFLEWENSNASSILWLNGKEVGAGKSTLTSKVIDRYRIDAESLVGGDKGPAIDEAFAFFYCSKTDVEISDGLLTHTLRSYLRQLATVPHHPTKMESGLVKLCNAMQMTNQSFTVTECKKRITELVGIFPRTTLVLDGLDECDKATRKTLVEFFAKLIKESQRPVRIFISSRDEDHIRKLLPMRNVIEVKVGQNNKADIEKYIDAELDEIGDEWSQQAKLEVKDKLSKGGDGMFRWVHLQMDQLKDLTSDEAILERLGKLPRGLMEAYDELYNNNQGYDRVILQRAVKWVMHAQNRVKTTFLLSAVRIGVVKDDKDSTHLYRSSYLTKAQLAFICRHLLVGYPTSFARDNTSLSRGITAAEVLHDTQAGAMGLNERVPKLGPGDADEPKHREGF